VKKVVADHQADQLRRYPTDTPYMPPRMALGDLHAAFTGTDAEFAAFLERHVDELHQGATATKIANRADLKAYKRNLHEVGGEKYLQFDPRPSMERKVAASAPPTAEAIPAKMTFTPTPETETMWQAFRVSLEKASDQAYKTHFFNPERGFLERTINHPYLGLYPLSYMWGKVLPEFARFLLAKPFGLDAPLLGWDAAQHVQEAMLVQMNDPEFAKQMNDNKGLIYLIQLMLPATPENIPVNAPAWARHAAAAAAGGKKWNAGTELADLPQNIGVMRMIPTLQQGLGPSIGSAVGALGGAIGDRLTNDIDISAKLYDSNVKIQPVLRSKL
jgi:hypothetical protein